MLADPWLLLLMGVTACTVRLSFCASSGPRVGEPPEASIQEGPAAARSDGVRVGVRPPASAHPERPLASPGLLNSAGPTSVDSAGARSLPVGHTFQNVGVP